MKRLKEILLPRENRFVQYLIQQAEVTVQGVRVLHRFVTERPQGEDRDEQIVRMSDLEKQGDDIRRLIIQELLDTFVTPIDREDIYNLSRSVDDILDYADSTIKELVLYHVDPTPEMVDMVAALYDGVVALRQAIQYMVDEPRRAVQHIVAAKKAENRIEDLYRRANADLFDLTDMHHIFKVREVYRHLSNSADRADEAADVIGSIVIKGNV
ncbi:DUF47 domain-containing protein [Alicyclobacillus macrosporangiidus]|uniref:TIGR00153 family protein n=1 Tax=Alicyclobacillus macrosporangiidus TaxID=392015 RepID=A0A1I7JR87_9BACL|nr:DUF47 family protein [Alicyclobacillus macrosporangiidus]SFU87682.1 hypothetical protein SAMN05421543_11171 [Alicyclobacillus macrosporangiidus]